MKVGPWIDFECVNGNKVSVYAPLIVGILDVDECNVTMVIEGNTAESYRNVYYVKGRYDDVFERIAEVLLCRTHHTEQCTE